MITFRTGNILESNAEALVNTVNCVGIMGRGVALAFKQAFPANFKAYAAACGRHEVKPGRMFVFETRLVSGPKYIINFPTKRHWRGKSRIEDIEAGLVALVAEIKAREIRSVALPPLGSGLGGLDWRDVRPRIERALQPLAHVDIAVYEPLPSAAPTVTPDRRPVPAMTAGRAALVQLIRQYLGGLLDPSVTLLEVHKLMYFMQEAGEPLKLRYQQGPYGPYAENLRHVLRAVEGHFVSGFTDNGDRPGQELVLVPGAIEDAEAFLTGHDDARRRLERVAELVSGFESAFGLELLATVHWVITRTGAGSLDAVVSATYAWSERKRQFTERQIALAVDTLTNKGWTPQLAPAS